MLCYVSYICLVSQFFLHHMVDPYKFSRFLTEYTVKLTDRSLQLRSKLPLTQNVTFSHEFSGVMVILCRSWSLCVWAEYSGGGILFRRDCGERPHAHEGTWFMRYIRCIMAFRVFFLVTFWCSNHIQLPTNLCKIIMIWSLLFWTTVTLVQIWQSKGLMPFSGCFLCSWNTYDMHTYYIWYRLGENSFFCYSSVKKVKARHQHNILVSISLFTVTKHGFGNRTGQIILKCWASRSSWKFLKAATNKSNMRMYS